MSIQKSNLNNEILSTILQSKFLVHLKIFLVRYKGIIHESLKSIDNFNMHRLTKRAMRYSRADGRPNPNYKKASFYKN